MYFHNGHLLFTDDLRHFIRFRIHQHDVDAERFIGKGLAFLYMAAQRLRIHASGADGSEGTCSRHSRRKFSRGDIGHTALKDREFYI